jgi:thioredoxin
VPALRSIPHPDEQGIMSDSSQVKDFLDRLQHNGQPVVVDFWAPWCGPCRRIEPIVHKLEKEYNGRVDLWRINADEQPELLRHLNIYGIPTLVAFQGENEIQRSTGLGSTGAIQSLFEAALNGETAVRSSSIDPLERVLRLGAGIFLIALGAGSGFSGIYLGLAALGGLVAFSAVHDRCPIWQAIAPKASAWLRAFSGRAG